MRDEIKYDYAIFGLNGLSFQSPIIFLVLLQLLGHIILIHRIEGIIECIKNIMFAS